MESPKLKAIAYCRVSTLLNQDPALQLSSIEQFAEARGYALIKSYIDEGISGTRERRPALDAMVSDARQGKFKVLIVVGIDRLARDTRHLLNLINELKHYGVSLISIRESIDFTSPMGQAALTILGAMAQLERSLISERIKSALAAKKLAAEKSGSGWKSGRRPVANDKMEAEIYLLREQGLSIRVIAKRVGIAKTSVQRILKKCPSNLRKSRPVTT